MVKVKKQFSTANGKIQNPVGSISLGGLVFLLTIFLLQNNARSLLGSGRDFKGSENKLEKEEVECRVPEVFCSEAGEGKTS